MIARTSKPGGSLRMENVLHSAISDSVSTAISRDPLQDLRGDLPLLQYQPSKIDPLQPGVIDVHELSPGVGEVQKIILFSDRKCVRETQG